MNSDFDGVISDKVSQMMERGDWIDGGLRRDAPPLPDPVDAEQEAAQRAEVLAPLEGLHFTMDGRRMFVRDGRVHELRTPTPEQTGAGAVDPSRLGSNPHLSAPPPSDAASWARWKADQQRRY